MTTAAEGILSDAVDAGRMLLAATARWQAITGSANRAQAFERTWHDSLPLPANGQEYTVEEWARYRPYALGHNRSLRSEKQAEGGRSSWQFGGIIELEIHQEAGNADRPANLNELVRRFENDVGTIWYEMLELREDTSESDLLAIQAISMDEPYMTTLDRYVQRQGREIMVVLSLEWGLIG